MLIPASDAIWAKTVFESFSKFNGVSNSIRRPLSRTIILRVKETTLEFQNWITHIKFYRWQSIIVLSLWAIVITVQSGNWLLIVSRIKASISTSTAAVASSRIRILDFLSKALAKQSNWRCPTLNDRRSGYKNRTERKYSNFLFCTSN